MKNLQLKKQKNQRSGASCRCLYDLLLSFVPNSCLVKKYDILKYPQLKCLSKGVSPVFVNCFLGIGEGDRRGVEESGNNIVDLKLSSYKGPQG